MTKQNNKIDWVAVMFMVITMCGMLTIIFTSSCTEEPTPIPIPIPPEECTPIQWTVTHADYIDQADSVGVYYLYESCGEDDRSCDVSMLYERYEGDVRVPINTLFTITDNIDSAFTPTLYFDADSPSYLQDGSISYAYKQQPQVYKGIENTYNYCGTIWSKFLYVNTKDFDVYGQRLYLKIK